MRSRRRHTAGGRRSGGGAPSRRLDARAANDEARINPMSLGGGCSRRRSALVEKRSQLLERLERVPPRPEIRSGVPIEPPTERGRLVAVFDQRGLEPRQVLLHVG